MHTNIIVLTGGTILQYLRVQRRSERLPLVILKLETALIVKRYSLDGRRKEITANPVVSSADIIIDSPF